MTKRNEAGILFEDMVRALFTGAGSISLFQECVEKPPRVESELETLSEDLYRIGLDFQHVITLNPPSSFNTPQPKLEPEYGNWHPGMADDDERRRQGLLPFGRSSRSSRG